MRSRRAWELGIAKEAKQMKRRAIIYLSETILIKRCLMPCTRVGGVPNKRKVRASVLEVEEAIILCRNTRNRREKDMNPEDQEPRSHNGLRYRLPRNSKGFVETHLLNEKILHEK
jgi:hypothetical protein